MYTFCRKSLGLLTLSLGLVSWKCSSSTAAAGAKASGVDDGLTSNSSSCGDPAGLEFIGQQRRLMSCLLKDYNPAVRPAGRPDEAVHVSVNSVVMTITDLNEKTGILTTDSWLKQTWLDVQLSWKEKEFGGLKEIHLPIERIWKPEIVLFNNADESFFYVLDKMAVVNSTGHVSWVPHVRLRSFCNLDLTLFPFDTQECRLYLGTWTYDDTLVTVRAPDLNPFLPTTTEWEVLDFSAAVSHYSDDVRNYPTVVYTVRMKRLTVYYKYMLVAPTVILAVLTLALFWIPAASNERFVLATGILVSLTVLLVLLEGYLPTDLGKLPVIASYIGFNFVLLVMTIAVSILVLNCHHRGGARCGSVPGWIRSVFLGFLSRLMCVKSSAYTSIPMSLAAEENEARKELQEMLTTDTERGSLAAGGMTPLPRSPTMAIEKTMDEIRRYLRYLAAKSDIPGGQAVASHGQLVVGEWQQVALVVDRLAFWVFFLVTFITTIAVYRKS